MILIGNGDGTFQAAVHYLQPPDKSSLGSIFIASANLNGDAKPGLPSAFTSPIATAAATTERPPILAIR